MKRIFPVLFFLALIISACGSSAEKQPSVLPAQATAPVVAIPTLTPSMTFTPLPTIAIWTQTPTLTLFYEPTITSTPSWMDCPLIIERKDTSGGDVLHIRRCEDNLEYDLGPLPNGVYAAGPGNTFIVYVTDDGMAYAAKIGETILHVVANLKRERFFVAVNKQSVVKFSIGFSGEVPNCSVIIREGSYGQKKVYDIPESVQK